MSTHHCIDGTLPSSSSSGNVGKARAVVAPALGAIPCVGPYPLPGPSPMAGHATGAALSCFRSNGKRLRSANSSQQGDESLSSTQSRAPTERRRRSAMYDASYARRAPPRRLVSSTLALADTTPEENDDDLFSVMGISTTTSHHSCAQSECALLAAPTMPADGALSTSPQCKHLQKATRSAWTQTRSLMFGAPTLGTSTEPTVPSDPIPEVGSLDVRSTSSQTDMNNNMRSALSEFLTTLLAFMAVSA